MSAVAAGAAPTVNDQRYLAKLRTHWTANKSFPSLAKLADLLGMSSTGSMFEMVARLEEAGYLARKDGRVAPGKRFFAYQVLGTVRAGVPQPASDEPLAWAEPSPCSLLPCVAQGVFMPVFLPPTVAERPNERLRSWAVFEVLVPGLGERTRHVAGDVADGSGRVSSPLVAIDDAHRSVVTRSGRVYRLMGRPGLGLEGEHVWRNWLSGTEARDVNDATVEFTSRFDTPAGQQS